MVIPNGNSRGTDGARLAGRVWSYAYQEYMTLGLEFS